MQKVKLIGVGLVFFIATLATFSTGIYFGRSYYTTPVVFPDGLFVENYRELVLSTGKMYQQVMAPTAQPAVQGAETEANAAQLTHDLLTPVNLLRSHHGLGPLLRDELLCEKADQRLSEQIAQGKIDNHAGFGRVKDELFAAGYKVVGENLAAGFTTADQVVNVGWQNSASHLALLLSREYSLACGRLDRSIAVFIAGQR